MEQLLLTTLRNFLNAYRNVIESYYLSSSPLTNALLTEQRAAEVGYCQTSEDWQHPWFTMRMTQYAQINCLMFAHLLR